jgi:hypothetical protein
LRDWVPSINLRPAETFGEVIVLFDQSISRMATAPVAEAMKDKLASFGPEDYVLAVGDPALIAVACVIAARRNGGKLRLLKWDRMSRTYIPVEVQL